MPVAEGPAAECGVERHPSGALVAVTSGKDTLRRLLGLAPLGSGFGGRRERSPLFSGAEAPVAEGAAAVRVGLVATMGMLHEGHLDLVRAALDAGAEVCVITVFVNPTQFVAGEDLDVYPRDLAGDVAQLKDLAASRGREARLVVYAPDVDELYPSGAPLRIHPGPLGDVMEGVTRPGHFTGVCTVVAKLMLLVEPEAAYFGAKDYQQVCVVRSMARDLFLPCAIVQVPTAREPNGLARSSRNLYLSDAERNGAGAIHAGLRAAVRLWKHHGVLDAAALVREAERVMLSSAWRQEIPLDAANTRDTPSVVSRVDYLEVRAADTLVPLDSLQGVPPSGAVMLAEAIVGAKGARLLDNILFE